MNMQKIVIISTGGTFNKIYNPISGTLDMDSDSKSLKSISHEWLCKFEIVDIISKDSLDFDDDDRILLRETIQKKSQIFKKIIVIHGTDTMDISATFIDDSEIDAVIVFTGAMVPFSINPIEATANLSSAIGFASATNARGVYIAMNGNFGLHHSVKKDRLKGRFTS